MIDTFEMFDLEVDSNAVSRPAIPQSAYKPIKRCPNCQSVYLTDTNCEACGRSLLYHPIGEPFSAKSLYGFKERYYASFPVITKYFPFFENKTAPQAKTYSRQLLKRFDDLLEAFGTQDAINGSERRFFYVEMLELMDELLRYGIGPIMLQQKVEGRIMETGPLLSQKILEYLIEAQKENKLSKPWTELFLNHRFMGLRVEYWLKTILITTTVVTLAVTYYELISSQVGK
jgi:hypothetical protein